MMLVGHGPGLKSDESVVWILIQDDPWGIERHIRNSQWLQFLFLKFFHFMPCLLLYPIINNYH